MVTWPTSQKTAKNQKRWYYFGSTLP